MLIDYSGDLLRQGFVWTVYFMHKSPFDFFVTKGKPVGRSQPGLVGEFGRVDQV